MSRCPRSLSFASAALAMLAGSASAGAHGTPPSPEAVHGLRSVRPTCVAQAYAPLARAEGFRARCAAQRWSVTFDAQGFRLEPDHGRWSFGLALERWGFTGREREADAARDVRIEGTRLTRARDEGLDEWFVNEPHGLEHGFTVLGRPPGEGELVFELRLRGALRPAQEAGARGLSFSAKDGSRALRYASLLVVDAEGRDLPARLVVSGDAVRIEVDERGARYPLTVDPLAQQAYLKASNTDGGDEFAFSVAISGDTLVVGAREEASAATGVNGDETNDSAPESGAAYVFVRSGPSWVQQAYLKASNTGVADRFGGAVAIDGDTIVVGAANEDSSAIGVDGDAADNNASSSGAAYVFVRSGSSWSQQAYLKASNTGADDRFGGSVAISGDTIVVGADGEDSAATGIDGDQGDQSASGSGAAYVFVRGGSTWSQQAYLKASNTGTADRFGEAVGAAGDTLLVTARFEDSNATGVDGDETNNGAGDSGAAYVFVRSGLTWSQQAYLKASNTDSVAQFGVSAVLDGERALIGSYAESGGSTGVDGDPSDAGLFGAGAAYVFARSGSSWSQEAYLKASNTEGADQFGYGVALSGDWAAVGALGEDSSASGVGGSQANGLGDSGAAYLFVRVGSSWHPAAYLKASNPGPSDWFGFSVALSGDTLVVGALQEDSSATGVDGDGTDNGSGNSGAAYVFDLDDPGAFPSLCQGTPADCPCANGAAPDNGCDNAQGTGGVQLFATGTPALNDVVLHGTGYPIAGTPGVVVMRSPNLEGVPIAFGDGLRCAGAAGLVRLGATSAANAISTHPLSHAAGPGTFHYQLWYRNTPASFCTSGAFNLSNGVTIVWP